MSAQDDRSSADKHSNRSSFADKCVSGRFGTYDGDKVSGLARRGRNRRRSVSEAAPIRR